jgi:hypothetical protein
MKLFLDNFLDSDSKHCIETTHILQKHLHGLYEPPSLKQLKSLRYLLITTGKLPEVKSEELLGLSKIECLMLLKKLHQIYFSQLRSQNAITAINTRSKV